MNYGNATRFERNDKERGDNIIESTDRRGRGGAGPREELPYFLFPFRFQKNKKSDMILISIKEQKEHQKIFSNIKKYKNESRKFK